MICPTCKKPTIEVGDKYWCVGSDGIIYEITWNDTGWDELVLAYGNNFKSKKAAEQARDRIKKLLKK